MKTTDLLFQKIAPELIQGVSVNPATVLKGEVFFSLAKEQTKRISAVNQALSAGALYAVTDIQDKTKITHPSVCFTENPRGALMQLLEKTYVPDGHWPVLAAVTGTNGKSSTAWYLCQLLQHSGISSACLGTTGGHIAGLSFPSRLTTPDVCDFYKFLARAISAGCKTVVFEYSSHALDQDRLLSIGIAFSTFTNLTPEHLDYHGSMENYFAAKRKLFIHYTARLGEYYAIINADDPYGKYLLADCAVKRKKISYGFSEGADLRVTKYQLLQQGICFLANWRGVNYNFETQLLGLPNIYNITAACANALVMGVSPELLQKGVSNLTAVPGRFETVPNNRGFRIIIDYAHTPDALEKLLLNVRAITTGRIICVFGCGGNRDTSKRPVMGSIAEKNSDLSVITSDNPRDEDPEIIISQILSGFSQPDKATAITCRRAAIAHALKNAEIGDTVIIAGKGHESTQEIKGVLHPFVDRAVVKEILEEI